ELPVRVFHFRQQFLCPDATCLLSDASGSRRDGPSLMGDVAVHGRQVGSSEHLTSAASLYAGRTAARPGICLGCGGRLAVCRGRGWVVGRVAPVYDDTGSSRAGFVWL